jgi:predicted TIM-barrel fold metal-dependent hydrolase
MQMVAEIVDPHVHHWAPGTNPWYPALSRAGMDAIAHDYLESEYRADSAGYDVAAVVHVSATTKPRAHLDEQRWIDAMAERSGWPAAAIGTVDVGGPWEAVEGDLAAQARSPLFRGIRVLSGLDPSSDLAARLVHRLERSGLIFELVVHPAEMGAYRALLDQVPDLVAVVEHAGWPDSADAAHFQDWRHGMGVLAARPLTYCKVSGLAMTLHTVALDAQRPWIEGCLEAFGPRRCMFASNFPVDSLFGSFTELYTTYRAAAGQLPDEEQRALFAGTARHVYRI